MKIKNPFGPPTRVEDFISSNRGAIRAYLENVRGADTYISFDSIRADFPDRDDLSDGFLAAVFRDLGIDVLSD